MNPNRLIAGCALAGAMLGSAHAQTQIDLRTQTKSVDFSNATSTKPSKTGTSMPAACSVGETFLKTNATPGQNWYACTATNTWTLQSASLPNYVPSDYGKILANDEDGMQWENLDGDVSGPPDALTVGGIQGRTVSTAAPSTGHVLSWTGTQWAPQALTAGQVSNAVDKTAATAYSAGAKQTFASSTSASGLRVAPGALPGTPQAGDLAVDSNDANRAKVFDGASWISMTAVPNYSTWFVAATTVTVAGTAHKMGTASLVVECYDSAFPANRVEPDSVRVNPTTYDVTVTFTTPQSGSLVISAAGAGGSSGAESSATLDFPAIAAGACGAEQTLTVPGANPGDEVAAGWPGGLEAGLMGMMRVTGADTVSVRLCNLSGAAVNPAGATYRARLVRN